MLGIEEGEFNIGTLEMLLQFDDSAPWESIFSDRNWEVTFSGKQNYIHIYSNLAASTEVRS